jgi:co-chaperonin GroES (HSP10)
MKEKKEKNNLKIKKGDEVIIFDWQRSWKKRKSY